MLNLIRNSNWATGALIFFMPVLLIFFLGSQMAYSQVNGRFEAYQNIPEVTHLAQLNTLPPKALVLLRGTISPATPRPNFVEARPDLIVYQERPADGRDARYQEEFPLIFPQIVLDLPDGQIAILPSLTRQQVIQHELHAVPSGDRLHTGFGLGDVVTVQGQWQPTSGGVPALQEVTGISGVDKQTLLTEWQAAFQWVRWARNGLGLLSLLGLGLLIIQWRRVKTNHPAEESDRWPNQTTENAPII